MTAAFPWFPPEINSMLMYGGAGAGPLLTASAAWSALGADLSSAASAFESLIAELTGGPWTGPASMSMAAAAVPYVSWLQSAAAQAEAAAAQAGAAASSFEIAYVTTVPPAMVAENRVRLAALIATNILGQNTPAIAMTELEYLEMWAQDVAAMMGYYLGTTSMVATLPTFSAPPASMAGLGGGLGSMFSSFVSSFVSSLSSILPVGGLAGLAGQFQAVIAAIPSFLTSAVSGLASMPVAPLVTVAQIGTIPASVLVAPMVGGLAPGTGGLGLVGSATTFAGAPNVVGSALPGFKTLGGAAAGLGPVGAGLGEARLLGAISVPPTWQAALPAQVIASATQVVGSPVPAAATTAAAAEASAGGAPVMPMAKDQDGKPDEMAGRSGAKRHVVKARPTVVPRSGVR